MLRSEEDDGGKCSNRIFLLLIQTTTEANVRADYVGFWIWCQPAGNLLCGRIVPPQRAEFTKQNGQASLAIPN